MGPFRRKTPRKLGVETVANVLGALFIGAIVLFFFFYIFPVFFGDMFKSIALSSSDIVARDMAGLVSVSGIAPNQITIEYNPSSSTQYNASIQNRLVKIGLPIDKSNWANLLGVSDVSIAKIALDNLNVKIEMENNFEITKITKMVTDSGGNKVFQSIYSVIGKSNKGVS